MDIRSSRFGVLSVDEQRLIQFPRGLLGFPQHRRFALIQTGAEKYFFWLQCADEPTLAFVVADPSIFFKEYQVPLRPETMEELQMTDPSLAQVLVICNRVEDWLTGNLLGPLVINAANWIGSQVVLTEKKWTARQPLVRLQSEPLVVRAAA